MAIEAMSGLSYRDLIKTDLRNTDSINSAQIMKNSSKIEASTDTTKKDNKGNEKKENSESALVNQNQIRDAIDKANEKLKYTNTRCEFTYYEDINRVAIKVLDRETDEVIREIPPEETLELVQKLWEFAGLLFDEKR